MADILQVGYENAVRTRLGVKSSELPDSEINQRLIVDLAEATIKERVPDWSSVVDVKDLLLIESSIVAYICYLLCPGMARRVNQKVTTIDVKWEKEKVDWNARAREFLAESESTLLDVTSVEVIVGGDSQLFAIAKLGGETE